MEKKSKSEIRNPKQIPNLGTAENCEGPPSVRLFFSDF